MKKVLMAFIMIMGCNTVLAGGYYNDGIEEMATHWHQTLKQDTSGVSNTTLFLSLLPCNETQHGKVFRGLVIHPTYRNEVASVSGASYGTQAYWEKWMELQYLAYYDRAPDQAGWDFWVNELITGRTENSTVCAFLTSAEAKDRSEDICGNNAYLQTSEVLCGF